MNITKQITRTIGVLFLIIFISGVLVYQVLRGPFVFGDDFLINSTLNSNKIIFSTILSFFTGVLTILISILLLPIIKRFNDTLGYLYVTFCVLNFIAIVIESHSVVSLIHKKAS